MNSRLVREALEGTRNPVGDGAAHHLAAALRAARDKVSRPAWLLRLGLFLYDHLGGRKLLAADAKPGSSHAILRARR